MKRIDLILNNRHKDIKWLHELNELSSFYKIEVNWHHTKDENHAKRLAKTVADEGTSLIISVGGDGTAHQIINGMMLVTNEMPVLAIIPAGTGNDFMRKRTHFLNAKQIIGSFLNDKIELCDIGCISFQNNKKFFLNIADTGFGGSTVHTLNKQRKWLGGKLSYSVAIFRTFLSFKKPRLRISSQEWSHEGEVLLCAFCNGGVFGSGLTIHPTANPQDGKMNITLIGNVSLFDYIRYLPKLKRGTPINHPEVRYLEANKLMVQVLKGKSSTEADGEPVCETDFEVELLPRRIKLLVP